MAEDIGPVDFVLLEFPDQEFDGEAAEELMKVVDAGIISVYDLVAIRKLADGSIEGVEITDLDADGVGSFAAFAGARSGLLGDDDVSIAAEAMEPGTVAVLIVYENTWAGPFASAVLRHGGQMVASARIPVTDLLEVLEELEAAG